MLQREHETSAVTRVLTDSRALVARRADAEAIVVLPFDWLRATDTIGAEFAELARRAKTELDAVTLRVLVTGTVTDTATVALAATGWRR